MYDILTFGSITLDTIIPLNENDSAIEITKKNLSLHMGDKIIVDGAEICCGGGAANSATGFAKLGLKTAVYGCVGEKSKNGFLIHEMEKVGVDIDHLTYVPHMTSGFSIILVAPWGERTVLHRQMKFDRFNRDSLQSAPDTKAIYIGHLYEENEDILDGLPEWQEKNNSLFGWNPGKTQFQKGFDHFGFLFPSVHTIIFNQEEAEMFSAEKSEKIFSDFDNESVFGKKIPLSVPLEKISYRRDTRHIAEIFLSAGVAQVVITDGVRGAQFFSATEHYHIDTEKVKKVDTLGAGDAFSVGFFGAVLQKKTTAQALLWGAKNATAVVQSRGGQAGQLTAETIGN